MDVEDIAKSLRLRASWSEYDPVTQNLFDEAAEALSRQKAAGEAMAEALRTFANCLEYIEPDESDEEWAKFRLLIGDYRKAAVALTAWNSIGDDNAVGGEGG